MIVTEDKIEVRLRSPLARYMDERDISVRELARLVSDRKRAWSYGTIAYLRGHTDRSVDPILAARLAKALDFPYTILFSERVSNVSRPVGPKGERRRAA